MKKLITNNINRRKLIKIIAVSAIGSTTYGMYNFFNNKDFVFTIIIDLVCSYYNTTFDFF